MAREAFCLASGPSLTTADVELVRRWRGDGFNKDREVIVVNTTFRLAPWADALYAMDRKWWIEYAAEILATFPGERFAPHRPVKPEVRLLEAHDFNHFSNSGAGAISLAVRRGAKTVYLLGYDCRRGAKGQAHWHPDHPGHLSNALSIHRWPVFFGRVARHAEQKGAKVLNCSRATALTCFKRRSLEVVIPAAEAVAA